MKKIISLFFVLLMVNNCYAQFSDLDLTTKYNQIGKAVFKFKTGILDPQTGLPSINTYYGTISNNNERDAAGACGMPYVLESLIRMYNTTKDKAYLYEFMRQALEMMHWRANYNTVPDNFCFSNLLYDDALICWAFSHFVYEVMHEDPNGIGATTISPNIDFMQPTNNHFGITFTTFYDFANWLRQRTEETVDFYTYGYKHDGTTTAAYWANDATCYKKTPSSYTAEYLNQQDGFGAALFYLGITDPNPDYLHKAAMMALAYKGVVYDETNCDWDCNIFGNNCHWESDGFTTPRNVIELLSNNSYSWKGLGWHQADCVELNNTVNPDDYEDISHGIQSLVFPRTIYNKLTTNGNMCFDDEDMIRFRNTFAKNVFAGYTNDCPDIHSAVDGDDIITYRINSSGVHDYDGFNNEAMLSVSTSWMDFYNWDEADVTATSPNVYEIIMKNYECRFVNEPTNKYFTGHGGIPIYGLAQLVDAQWDKDCPDLNLYNRDVVYDQDFWSKHNITIAPIAQQSYADPVINSDDFIIRSGKTSNLTAGNEIALLDGFAAEEGSNVSMTISPLGCGNTGRYAMGTHPTNNTNNVTDNQTNTLQSKGKALNTSNHNNAIVNNAAIFVSKFSIYPNPANTTITLNLPTNQTATVTFTDMLGNEVISSTSEIQHSEFNIQNLPKGIYFVTAKTTTQQFVSKLVKE